MANDQPTFMGPEEKEFQKFYKWSVFWIKIRGAVKRVGLGAFIALDAVLLIIYFWALIDFGIINFFNERAMVGSIVDGLDHFHSISEAHAAMNLEASETKIFPLDAARVDFFATLSNPNDDWYARFTYQFTYGDQTTAERQGFILPGEAGKPIVELAATVASAPRAASLAITNLQWIRLNGHAISDYPDWQSDRLNFESSNVAYDREVPLDSTTVGQTTFTVVNQSAFGYWDGLFTVVLLRNQTPVGVTTVNLSSFEPGTSRDVSLNWFGEAPQANQTLILPNIDIFDPQVYLPIRGEAEPDVRERIRIKRR